MKGGYVIYNKYMGTFWKGNGTWDATLASAYVYPTFANAKVGLFGTHCEDAIIVGIEWYPVVDADKIKP